MRMIELRDRFRLALKAQLELRARGQLGGQDLDGHGALEAGITGTVDLAHSARPER